MDLYFQEHEVNPNSSRTTNMNNSRRRHTQMSNELNAILLNNTLTPVTSDEQTQTGVQNTQQSVLPLLNLAIGDRLFQIPSDNSNGPPPASKKEIKNLPVVSFSQVPKTNPACAVCTDEFDQSDTQQQTITRLPCSHYFHRSCIITWLSKHCSCPVCRKELPTDDEDYEHMRRVKRREQATSQMRNFMFN